jgi:hypothetical protein
MSDKDKEKKSCATGKTNLKKQQEAGKAYEGKRPANRGWTKR